MPAATAAALTGIHNENEFYSHHHLSEIFSGDIRATVDRWREQADAESGRTWDEVVTRRVFGQDHPPRWLLVLSFSRVLLVERGKWTHNRLLRFDLDEILGRREDATLKAAAALLHRDCLLPPNGQSLLDSLDENSHKHAFAVSEDLKNALRESIELIGNEAIRYLREVLRDKVYDRTDDALAGQLGLECLRYMYRLLFLFYIEARPDLGYAPMDSETYLKGYSLEHLRDLELVRLTSEESLDGYYLHHAVQTLFALIRDGFDGSQRGGAADLLAAEPDAHLHHGFRIRALDRALFREGSTPLLDRVKLRNRVLQQVIRLMSLTRPAKGRRGRRGRISYAQLGINQLGAVYEALLSYRGFLAEEDLYEVKKAGEPGDPLKSAWFVPARDLDDYAEEERVYDKDDEGRRKLRVHPRGRFIYRLAGRDRQKTASYYTPESLTRCVVKYALRELIPDDMPADRILDLTVCEPAMGSAAFLNEAVNQLAEKYLERKQRELGRRIPHAEYPDELQHVKLYIADRNVYGVDLNPRHRFHHWELAFADLFYGVRANGSPHGGFDLVLGNPPWIKVEWEEAGVLGDHEPRLALRKLSAKQLSDRRADAFARMPALRGAWLDELEQAEATQAFLGARQNYPLLAGAANQPVQVLSTAGLDDRQRPRRRRLSPPRGRVRRRKGRPLPRNAVFQAPRALPIPEQEKALCGGRRHETAPPSNHSSLAGASERWRVCCAAYSVHRLLPRRRLDAPRPPPAERLRGAATEVGTERRFAHRFRPPAGARGDRRADGLGPRPDPRRAAHHLPRAVSRHAAVRGRHLVRRGGPHRVHRLQGAARRRPATEGNPGRHRLDASPPRRRCRSRHGARLGGRPGPPMKPSSPAASPTTPFPAAPSNA